MCFSSLFFCLTAFCFLLVLPYAFYLWVQALSFCRRHFFFVWRQAFSFGRRRFLFGRRRLFSARLFCVRRRRFFFAEHVSKHDNYDRRNDTT